MEQSVEPVTVIPGMGPSANERRRYIATSSFIDWAHTQNDPWSNILRTSVYHQVHFSKSTIDSIDDAFSAADMYFFALIADYILEMTQTVESVPTDVFCNVTTLYTI